MKQLIIDLANELIKANGKTTTLEVKNEAHSRNNLNPVPGFELTQQEVSTVMAEMYREAKGEISREMTFGSGQNFYEYSLSTPDTGIVATGSPIHSAVPSSKPVAAAKAAKVQPADALGSALGYLDADSLENEGKKYVAYDAFDTKNAFLFETTDKYAARAGFKTLSSTEHNNIRMAQLKNYAKIVF